MFALHIFYTLFVLSTDQNRILCSRSRFM